MGEQEAAVTSVTYHLYNASSPTGFSWWLKTNSPTGPMAVNQWQQQNRPAGYESSLSVWETSPGVPGQSGVLYAGTVITFKLWMRKTSKWGAYNPGAQLNLNFEWGLQGIHVTPICKAFSTAQLTTAQALYTFTCTVSRTVTLMSTDRFALWPMTRVVQQIDSHAQSIELGMQGPNAGTGDSRADIPVAQAIATTSNCPAANPNDQLPDDAALNACLGNGGVVTLANGAPGYIVASGLQLTRNGTTLNSASIDTPVVAGPDLQAPLLRVADGVTDYSISNLSFDGSRAARTHTADCATPATRSHGYNLQLRGSGYVVEHLRSRNALCGAGIEVDGGNSYTIRYNQVSDNGFDQTDAVAGGSADGIALTTCTGEVYENQIAENTEVDLRVGPPSSTAYSYYCHVGPNTITHATRYGRIGELVSGGDHNGGSAGLTTITAGYNLLSVGIMVGAHALDPTIDTLNAGQVTNSDISGPVIGMIIDGVTWGDIARNTVRSVQGYRGLGGCPASLAVVAQHYGTSIGEQTFTVRDLHPGSCSPCGDGGVGADEGCDTDVHNGIGTSACCSLACQQTGAATCTSEPGGGLWPGEQLGPDGRLTSPSGLSTLIYQLDGNLVLYQTDGAALWASGTFGDPGRAVMREDGTLAVYDAAGALQWASAATAPGARLVITENVEGIGDLTIY
ncbi:MAG TPA: hypothetical protein VL172_14365, partial [Kofleriaceae bacterium]|nr:hypothetical protein [Kofleriaceae bacterium]